jgi:PAS domain S-box-containing protein
MTVNPMKRVSGRKLQAGAAVDHEHRVLLGDGSFSRRSPVTGQGGILSKGRILVVDDSPEALLMLTETLTEAGYAVGPADSGELALASVATAKPELILLDIRMAGMDGLEVCRRLKARTETRDIPVVFLSGITEIKERIEGFSLGAVDFVTKPFQKEELLARIHTHLELSRLRNRLEHLVLERTAHLNAANEHLVHELAERIRVERALRESEERFRSVADSAPVVIWTSGPDDSCGPYANLTFVNAFGLTQCGRTLEELRGDRWREVIHPDDLGHVHPDLDPLTVARREFRAQYRLRRADGVYRWILDTAIPRVLADGSFAGYIGIGVDITDMKQQQEQLMAAQKLESLGILVSGIAHHFNNLMGAIIAEADLALSELPADSAAHGNAERISAIALRAADIVLMLTAYGSAAPTGELVPVSLSSVVEQILPLIKATHSKNVAFSIKLAKNVPLVRANTAQMRQAVMNLLTNACESLPNGEGSVSVSTSCVRLDDELPEKKPPGLPEGVYVQLCVTDTGCGISAEATTKIFDPFYTTKFLGRGLGLAAVQGIVRGLGGAVYLKRSAPGGGSTFVVLLPGMSGDGNLG